jgi:DNA-binding transcriptional regulator/RsmH inhibitor MraZ
VDQPQIPMPVVEMPRSMARARIDDKGRIKLAADYLHFFDALPERKVFVTSTDRRIAEIYPIASWRKMEDFHAKNEKLPSVRRAAFNAARFGAECEVDSQGRVSVNSELRRELGLDGQELHVYPYNRNRIRILTAAAYEASTLDAETANPNQDEDELLAAGRP